MVEKQNNYAMMQGILMRECGKKIRSGDETGRKIYVKINTKNVTFLVFCE